MDNHHSELEFNCATHCDTNLQFGRLIKITTDGINARGAASISSMIGRRCRDVLGAQQDLGLVDGRLQAHFAMLRHSPHWRNPYRDSRLIQVIHKWCQISEKWQKFSAVKRDHWVSDHFGHHQSILVKVFEVQNVWPGTEGRTKSLAVWCVCGRKWGGEFTGFSLFVAKSAIQQKVIKSVKKNFSFDLASLWKWIALDNTCWIGKSHVRNPFSSCNRMCRWGFCVARRSIAQRGEACQVLKLWGSRTIICKNTSSNEVLVQLP